jgi:beta-glucosidase
MGLLRSTAFLAALPLALAQNGTNSSTSNPFDNPGAVSGQTSPPSYPTPWGEGLGDWEDAYAKARDFVSQLTLLEKVNLTTGVGWEGEKCVGNTGAIPRLGFEALCLQDSPLGVRFADFVSAFPAGVTVAATWDRELFHLRGHDMGVEHREKGIDVQLGPAIGPIGRHPAGGRNWEGFSPDPVLSAVGVYETVKGIQESGVVCLVPNSSSRTNGNIFAPDNPYYVAKLCLFRLLALSITSATSRSTSVKADLMSARRSRQTSTIPLWYVVPIG